MQIRNIDFNLFRYNLRYSICENDRFQIYVNIKNLAKKELYFPLSLQNKNMIA